MYELDHGGPIGAFVGSCPVAVLSNMEKFGTRIIDLARGSHADLLRELKQWVSFMSTLRQGSRQRARHFTAAMTDGAVDASSIGRAGVLNAGLGPCHAWRLFPKDWFSRVGIATARRCTRCNNVLLQVCSRHPEDL